MTDTSGWLSDLGHSTNLHSVILADGSTSTISGLGIANLSMCLLTMLTDIYM